MKMKSIRKNHCSCKAVSVHGKKKVKKSFLKRFLKKYSKPVFKIVISILQTIAAILGIIDKYKNFF